MSTDYQDMKLSFDRFAIDFANYNFCDGKGTAFPTSSLTLNMVFYRSDQDKLYQLTSLGPSVWTQLPQDYYFVPFDFHSIETGYPDRHFIGTKDFSVYVDDKNYECSALVGFGLKDDPAGLKHVSIMDTLFQLLLPLKHIDIFITSTGVKSGSFIIPTGTEVLPMAKADQRPIQFIGIKMLTDRTVK